jgi:hypothetical protein
VSPAAVAARACVGGDGEESASDDEVGEDDNVGGSKVADDGVGEMFRGTGSSKELGVRVRPGRSLDDGDDFLAGKAAFPPVGRVQLGPRDIHGQPVNSGEFSTPILNQATTTTDPPPPERRRIKSSETLRQHGVVSTKKQVTIVERFGGSVLAVVEVVVVPRRRTGEVAGRPALRGDHAPHDARLAGRRVVLARAAPAKAWQRPAMRGGGHVTIVSTKKTNNQQSICCISIIKIHSITCKID